MKPLERIADGIGEMAWYGAAFTVIAILIYAAEGADIGRHGAMHLGQLLIVYGVVAVGSGALLGLLKPLATGWISTALVSMVVAWPAALVVLWFTQGRDVARLTAMDFARSAALAAVVGPLVAASVHLRFKAKNDIH